MYLRKMVMVTIMVTDQDWDDPDKDLTINYQCWVKAQTDNRYG